jgi:hypothetical protein
VKVHKKRSKSDVHFDKNLLAQLEKDNNESVVRSYEDDLLKEEFLSVLKDDIKRWRDKFDKEQEKIVLEAIIVLLENPDLIPFYNKKGVYLYIREITGLNTKQVVTNLTKFRKKYAMLKKKYIEGEL